MASIQERLLRVGGEIIQRESPLAVPCGDEVHRRWYNTERFLPGLCLLAVARRRESDPRRFAAITFGLLHPELGEEVLTVVSDPARRGVYENTLGEYVLRNFEAYSNRPDSATPIGTAGDVGGLVIFNTALMTTS